MIGPIKVHVDNKECLMDYEKEEKSVSSQEREMQNYGSKFWEELHSLVESDILVQVEHVKAHLSKKGQGKYVAVREVLHGRQ